MCGLTVRDSFERNAGVKADVDAAAEATSILNFCFLVSLLPSAATCVSLTKQLHPTSTRSLSDLMSAAGSVCDEA